MQQVRAHKKRPDLGLDHTIGSRNRYDDDIVIGREDVVEVRILFFMVFLQLLVQGEPTRSRSNGELLREIVVNVFGENIDTTVLA